MKVLSKTFLRLLFLKSVSFEIVSIGFDLLFLPLVLFVLLKCGLT